MGSSECLFWFEEGNGVFLFLLFSPSPQLQEGAPKWAEGKREGDYIQHAHALRACPGVRDSLYGFSVMTLAGGGSGWLEEVRLPWDGPVVRTGQTDPFYLFELGGIPGICTYLVSGPTELEDLVILNVC